MQCKCGKDADDVYAVRGGVECSECYERRIYFETRADSIPKEPAEYPYRHQCDGGIARRRGKIVSE